METRVAYFAKGDKCLHNIFIGGGNSIFMGLDVKSVEGFMLSEPSVWRLILIGYLLARAKFSDVDFFELLNEMLHFERR